LAEKTHLQRRIKVVIFDDKRALVWRFWIVFGDRYISRRKLRQFARNCRER
jgi:hypothetical protein